MVGAGFANTDIASRLSVGRSTVYSHLSSIYAKLAISSRIQLQRLVVQQRSRMGDDLTSPAAASGALPSDPRRTPEALELARRFDEAWRDIWLRLRAPDTPSLNDHLVSIVRHMSTDEPESLHALA